MIRPFEFDNWGNMRLNEKSHWPSRVPPSEQGWKFWHHFWDGPERIVFGHSVLTKPLVTEKVVGLDGGGVFGFELWALVLPDNEIVRVNCANSSAISYKNNRDVKFCIDEKEDVYTY